MPDKNGFLHAASLRADTTKQPKKTQALKTIAYILTLTIQFALIVWLKLIDNLLLIYITFISCALVGLALSLTNSKIKDIGKGLLWGSITSICFTTLFLLWLKFNFPE